MATLWRRFVDSKNLRNIGILGVGTLVAQAIPVLISPVLSRIYTPEDFGVWGVYGACLGVLYPIACGRYDVAIVKAKYPFEAKGLAILSLVVSLAFTLLLLGVAGISVLAGWQTTASMGWLAWLLPFHILFSAVIQVYINFSNFQERYTKIAVAGVLRNFSQAGFRVGLGALGVLRSGLVVGAFSSLFVQLGYYLWHFPLKTLQLGRQSIMKVVRLVAARHYRFPLYDVPGTLASLLGTNIPIVIFAAYYGKEPTGYFTMSTNLLYMPISVIGASVGQVLYRNSSTMGAAELRRFALRIFWTLLVVGGLFHAMIFFFGQRIFSVFLGAGWAVSGEYAKVLSIWTCPLLVFTPFSVLFLSRNKQLVGGVFNAVQTVLRIAAMVLCGELLLGASAAVLVFALIGAGVWVVEGGYLLKMMRKR